MSKPTLVLKCEARHYKKVLVLAEHVYKQMFSNVYFPNPIPALPSLNTAIGNLATAIGLWGVQGSHTGTKAHKNVLARSRAVHSILLRLAQYCMNTVDDTLSYEEQTVILLSSGFPVKNPRTPQGVLQAVQNFRRFISRELNEWEIKMRWKKPLNVATRSNVKAYHVKRNTTNNYATTTIIATPTATTYTDSPPAGTYYYWVVGVNYKGEGVVSPVIIFRTFGPPSP